MKAQTYATKEDVKEIVGQSTDKLIVMMGKFANDVSGRFDKVEGRLGKIEAKLDDHDKQFAILNEKYDHLLNTIDGFIARIDRYETEQLARDNQFAKLLDWARKVSKKTGIPLENL